MVHVPIATLDEAGRTNPHTFLSHTFSGKASAAAILREPLGPDSVLATPRPAAKPPLGFSPNPGLKPSSAATGDAVVDGSGLDPGRRPGPTLLTPGRAPRSTAAESAAAAAAAPAADLVPAPGPAPAPALTPNRCCGIRLTLELLAPGAAPPPTAPDALEDEEGAPFCAGPRSPAGSSAEAATAVGATVMRPPPR